MASSPSRPLTLLALAVVGAVVWWLLAPGLPAEDLGPARALVGRAGVPRFALQREQGWELWSARGEAPLAALEGLVAAPRLTSDGGVLAQGRQGLLGFAADGSVRPAPELPPPELAPGPWSLAGLDGLDRPVLVGGPGEARRVAVRDEDDRSWQLLADGAGAAQPPADQALVMAPVRRALAFRGPRGWEAWSFGGPDHARLVAEDCRREPAVFTPDGSMLIVDGRFDGLFLLELDHRRVSFMAQGNLGGGAPVPFSAGFRGDPLVLVAGQRGLDGHLQITQTHLRGQGRQGLTTGAAHHYGPVLASGGRFMAYRLADWRDDGGPEQERLYLFDFLSGSSVFERSRQAQGLDAGPTFVGDRATLVFLAESRAWRVEAPDD